MGLGASGGLVLHAGGLTLSPPLGDTIALVHAPGAAGMRVENSGGSRVDRRGFAVVPYLTPYQLNTISLDPKGAGYSVELQETARAVAPRAGALVKLDFSTRASRGLMVDSQTEDGRPLPFGAEATDASGATVGVVGQGSRLLLSGLQSSGPVQVQWGEGADHQCVVDVQIPDGPVGGQYAVLSAQCRSPSSMPTVTRRPRAGLPPPSRRTHRDSHASGRASDRACPVDGRSACACAELQVP